MDLHSAALFLPYLRLSRCCNGQISRTASETPTVLYSLTAAVCLVCIYACPYHRFSNKEINLAETEIFEKKIKFWLGLIQEEIRNCEEKKQGVIFVKKGEEDIQYLLSSLTVQDIDGCCVMCPIWMNHGCYKIQGSVSQIYALSHTPAPSHTLYVSWVFEAPIYLKLLDSAHLV